MKKLMGITFTISLLFVFLQTGCSTKQHNVQSEQIFKPNMEYATLLIDTNKMGFIFNIFDHQKSTSYSQVLKPGSQYTLNLKDGKYSFCAKDHAAAAVGGVLGGFLSSGLIGGALVLALEVSKDLRDTCVNVSLQHKKLYYMGSRSIIHRGITFQGHTKELSSLINKECNDSTLDDLGAEVEDEGNSFSSNPTRIYYSFTLDREFTCKNNKISKLSNVIHDSTYLNDRFDNIKHIELKNLKKSELTPDTFKNLTNIIEKEDYIVLKE